MNCFYHDNKPAIVSCAKCGVGLCKNCMTNAAYTYDGKPLCLNCSQPIAEDELKEAQSSRIWSLVKFIFSGFFLGLGLMAFAGGADIMNVWIISGVAGIPTAFKATRRSREQRIMDEIHDRYERDMINLMFGWAVRLLIKLVFVIGLAPLCAIYTFISNLITFIKSKKKINEAQDALYYIEQCLNGEQESFAEQESQFANPTSAYVPVQPENPAQQVCSNQTQTNVIHTQSTQTFQTPSVAPSYPTPPSPKQNSALITGISISVLILVGFIAGYFMWYVPYAKDKNALRTYVIANNLFLRSSKVAGVEYNILSKISYGSELITYSKDTDWAEIQVNGMKGFVASPFLLEYNDFKLLNDVWGNADTKEYIESSKCRLAILDYCKRNQLTTGNDGWQLYTLQKNVKPNNVLFPRLNNGYEKFTEFAFILKNNTTKERRFAIYAFDEETEQPIFLYDENAPENGQIKNIEYIDSRNEYYVTYTGNDAIDDTEETDIQPAYPNTAEEVPYTPTITEAEEVEEEEFKTAEVEEEKLVKENNSTQTDTKVNEPVPAQAEDNIVYNKVEEMPKFPNGGTIGLMKFISKNLKYPPTCEKAGIEGKVIVSFMVNKDGSISDFRIIQSVNKDLDNEALRVLSSMPKWIPGKQKGIPVRVKYTIPINFTLS